MRNFYALVIATLVMTACSEKCVEHYQINGHIEGVSNKQVVLERIGTESLKQLDTAMVDANGDFTLRGVAEDDAFCRIFLDKRHSWLLVLENKTYDVNLNFNDLSSTFNGSTSSNIFRDLIENQRTFFTQMNVMKQEYSKSARKGDMDVARKIQDQIEGMQEDNIAFVKHFLDTSQSVVRLFAYNFLNFEDDLEFVEMSLNKEAKDLQEHYYFKDLQERLKKVKFLSIGSKAPDLSYPNPNGEVLHLSDLEGKVVLLDFWASWCAPCRKENPNVVKMYNQYKDQGFEVFSVSLDKKKDQWIQAIGADDLTWTNHVSDLNGWKSEAAAQYGIKSIPATFLLDREGKIVAKNLRGAELEAKLKELF